MSVKTPPRRGPATEAIPYLLKSAMVGVSNNQNSTTYMAPINPVYIGLLTKGTEYATICEQLEARSQYNA